MLVDRVWYRTRSSSQKLWAISFELNSVSAQKTKASKQRRPSGCPAFRSERIKAEVIHCVIR
jgi:hypothetical protein